MTLYYSVYCKSCNKNTGLATSKKEALEEMTYGCLHCGHNVYLINLLCLLFEFMSYTHAYFYFFLGRKLLNT